jgi:hypothetical protein
MARGAQRGDDVACKRFRVHLPMLI